MHVGLSNHSLWLDVMFCFLVLCIKDGSNVVYPVSLGILAC